MTMTFRENSILAAVAPKGLPGTGARDLSVQVINLCRTLDDIQRCAAMGDFASVRYDVVAA